MKFKSAFVILLNLFLILSLIHSLHGITFQEAPNKVWANEEYDVNTQGWGTDHFANIQDAIDNVDDEGIVFLLGDIYRSGPYPIEIIERDISIIGNGNTRIIGNGQKDVFNAFDSDINLENCIITNGMNGIKAIRSNVALNGIKINNNALNGIMIKSLTASNAKIKVTNCIIDNNSNGITCYSFFNSGLEAMIINNIISNNHANGISLASINLTNRSCKVVNNIVSDNSGVGLFSFGNIGIVSNNDFWNNTKANTLEENITGRFENISADPFFIEDYRLDIYSPCIDTGLDTNRNFYGDVNLDADNLARPQGKHHDMGAYESAVVNILQLSDPHLLAPVYGQLAYGKGYDTYIWENVDTFLSQIENDAGPKGIDLVVITGDIVNWSTNSDTYKTFFGENFVVTEWKNTYEGYVLFKEKIIQHFGDIPILEVTGNHEYREHPFLFWTWNDTIGIDENFMEQINYSDYIMVSLSSILNMPLKNDILIHLLNSGHDVIGTNYILNNLLLPYLSHNAVNFDELLPRLEGGMNANNLYEFSENLAYGSGFNDSQIDSLTFNTQQFPENINLIFCHHPIVYPGITISKNIDDFLDICKDFIVPFVFSGHTHTNESYPVEWMNGSNTFFNTVGSAIENEYCLISCQLGNDIKIILNN